MVRIIFLVTGIVAGIHVYTYGCWLKQQGKISGFILTIIFAAATIALPAWHLFKRIVLSM